MRRPESTMPENTALWSHCLEHAALSEVGLVRSSNQDSLAVALADSQQAWQQRGHLFIVADGMGAHAAGELASQLAVEAVRVTYDRLRNRPPPEAILEAMHEANARLFNRGQASGELRGMGTTLSTLVLLPQGALAAHVGDSRVYRLRDNRLEQLTFDHSLVWEVCAAEGISEAEVPSYVPRNVITRSVGPHPEVQVDLEGPLPLEIGDTFVLCSDGLSGMVDDREVGTILRCLPPDEAVAVLVDLALMRGGPDNISVIAVRVTGPQSAAGEDVSRSGSGTLPQRRIHPLLWTLPGALALASLGLFLWGYELAALVGLIGALATGLAAAVYHRGEPRLEHQFDGQPLGNGPYTEVDCPPDQPFADHLAEIVRRLRDAAVDQDWGVDFDQLDRLSDRAAAATGSGDYAQAVREHCRAIRFMMDRLKERCERTTPDDDSTRVQSLGQRRPDR